MSTLPSEALPSNFELLAYWVLDQLAHRQVSPIQAESWLWSLVEMEEKRNA